MGKIVNKLVFISILISGIFMLSGCSEKIVKVPVEVPVYKGIPKTLLIDDINLPEPMDKKTYLKANPIEREIMLTTYINKLFNTIGSYKIKLLQIHNLDKKNRIIVEREALKIKKENKLK